MIRVAANQLRSFVRSAIPGRQGTSGPCRWEGILGLVRTTAPSFRLSFPLDSREAANRKSMGRSNKFQCEDCSVLGGSDCCDCSSTCSVPGANACKSDLWAATSFLLAIAPSSCRLGQSPILRALGPNCVLPASQWETRQVRRVK
jgi:hypothetical protein